MGRFFLISLFLFYQPVFSQSKGGGELPAAAELDKMIYYFRESGLYSPEAFQELQAALHSVLAKKNLSLKSFHKFSESLFENKKLSELELLELMKISNEIQSDPEAQKALRKQPFYWTFGITSAAMVLYALAIPPIKGNPLDPILFSIQASLFLSSMSLYYFNVFRENSAVKKILRKAAKSLSAKSKTAPGDSYKTEGGEASSREEKINRLYSQIIQEPYQRHHIEIVKGRKETYENIGNIFFTGGLGLLAIHFISSLEGTLLLGEVFSASGLSLCALAFMKKRELKKLQAAQKAGAP